MKRSPLRSEPQIGDRILSNGSRAPRTKGCYGVIRDFHARRIFVEFDAPFDGHNSGSGYVKLGRSWWINLEDIEWCRSPSALEAEQLAEYYDVITA